MKKSTLLFGLVSLIFIGCNSSGKSDNDKYSEVFTKHDTRISDIRTFLSGLSNSLPEAGTKTEVLDNLNPALNLGNFDTTGNTLVLQFHLLNSPENFTSYDSLFGMYYDVRAMDALKWTGKNTKERMIFERDYLKDAEIDKILSSLSPDYFPYLIIVKATNFEALKKNDNKTFEGGGATASFYLYDLRNKKPLASIALSASPDKELLFAFSSKDTYQTKENEAFEMKVKETVNKNMRAKVYEWLKSITNNNVIVPNK